MTYPEVLANARECIGKYCKACPVCNGVACKNQIPLSARNAAMFKNLVLFNLKCFR